MRELTKFLRLVAKQWVYLLSGTVSVAVSFVERVRRSPIPDAAFWVLAGICLFWACFLAWRETARQLPSYVERLTQLAKSKSSVTFHPVIPRIHEELFRFTSIDSLFITLTSNRNQSALKVPISRIKGILESDSYPTIELMGRIQRVSALESWKFVGDAPTDEWGIPKTSGLQDEAVRRVQRIQEENGFRVSWRRAAELSASSHSKAEVIYDDDGRYFRIPDPHGPLVLVRSR